MKDLGSIEVGIIGGGIAGLSFAILCAKSGLNVTLFEKQSYPRHKVCGEYVSNESKAFLIELGLNLGGINYPEINKFTLTSKHNTTSTCQLNPGGFGLSRFVLDSRLSDLAKAAGAKVIENARINGVSKSHGGISLNSIKGETWSFDFVFNAGGRVVDTDSEKHSSKSWIGIKYHLSEGPPKDTIEIHAFPDGYAGVSAIEDGKYCMAYLAKADGLKSLGSNIEEFEKKVLGQNHFLADRLKVARTVGPIATSQFSFGVNKPTDSITTLGDAAGFIPPLTGNGMSLALRSSKLVYHNFMELLSGSISEVTFEKRNLNYRCGYLGARIGRGILLQELMFLKPEGLNKLMMQSFTLAPWALRGMTKLAVGKTI